MFLPAIVPQSNRTSHLFWSSIWNFSSSLVLNGSRWEDNFRLALHIWHFVVFGDVLQLGRPKYRVDDDCKKAKVQMRGGVVWNRVILDSHSWPETVEEVKWYIMKMAKIKEILSVILLLLQQNCRATQSKGKQILVNLLFFTPYRFTDLTLIKDVQTCV